MPRRTPQFTGGLDGSGWSQASIPHVPVGAHDIALPKPLVERRGSAAYRPDCERPAGTAERRICACALDGGAERSVRLRAACGSVWSSVASEDRASSSGPESCATGTGLGHRAGSSSRAALPRFTKCQLGPCTVTVPREPSTVMIVPSAMDVEAPVALTTAGMPSSPAPGRSRCRGTRPTR